MRLFAALTLVALGALLDHLVKLWRWHVHQQPEPIAVETATNGGVNYEWLSQSR